MFYVFEIAVGFVYHFKVGEGVIEACHDLLKIVKLMLVDNADQNRLFIPGISADGIQLGAAVAELLGDLLDKFILVGGDNSEFICRFGGFQQLISHKGGDEAVEDAQRHRLVIERILGIDDHRGNCHDAVENKGHGKEVGVGADFVDIPGDHIGAAGGGVISEANAVNHAADHAAEDHRVNGIVSLGVVLYEGKPGILQSQKGKRIGNGKQQSLHRKLLLYQKIGGNGQGNIDEQGHITDAEAGFILDHCGDTVEASRGEIVGYDKNEVVKYS